VRGSVLVDVKLTAVKRLQVAALAARDKAAKDEHAISSHARRMSISLLRRDLLRGKAGVGRLLIHLGSLGFHRSFTHQLYLLR